MSRRKPWFSKPSLISEDSDQKIIWNSSSSSDEGNERNSRKKVKLNCKTSSNQAESDEKPLGKSQQKKNDFSSVSFESFFPVNSSPSPILGIYLLESDSPILGLNTFVTKSNSPVLFQRQIMREESPVLPNLQILSEIRVRRQVRKLQIQQSPPDSIEPLSNMIQKNDSPKYENELIQIESICSQDKISTDKPCGNEKITIEPVCSQKVATLNPFGNELITIEHVCSQEESIGNESENKSTSTQDSFTVVDQSGNSSGPSCYHQPKKNKKQCKPGGLLHQIQQTINLKSSRMSLWHHDIYSKKFNPSQFEHIQCHVQNYWREYGCTIFNCCDIDNKEFLVCLGHNTTSALFDVEFVEIMKIFPPFKEKWVERDNKKVKLYYNITKILLHKMNKPVSLSIT